MIEHPNSLLLHHCLQAVNAGDRQTLKALWADDIVWHVNGHGPWKDELKGPDEIFEYLATIGDVAPMGLYTEIEDVLISTERAAVICRSRANHGGQSLDTRYLVITRIANRRIQEMLTVPIEPESGAAIPPG